MKKIILMFTIILSLLFINGCILGSIAGTYVTCDDCTDYPCRLYTREYGGVTTYCIEQSYELGSGCPTTSSIPWVQIDTCTAVQCTNYPDGGTLSPPANDGTLYCNPSDDKWYECSSGNWIYESTCDGECVMGICEEVPTEETWKGFCLNKQNNCIYIDRTYTELQQIRGTYDGYECIKPSFPNLYSIQDECESNREKEITCYTQCSNSFYEEKIVTAIFCRDKGLLSIPPSDCISPGAKGCTYLGRGYDAGEKFCYQGNIGRCMGDEKIDVVVYCDVDCENAKCTEEEIGKVCCRTWGLTTTKDGQLIGTYYYNKEDDCPIGLNVKEVDMDYCTGEKEPETPPEVDEETEEGVPEETEGIEKCSLSLGAYCKPTNVPGTWDDSSPHNLCKSGWCQDLKETGLGGRCAKVGTMKNGEVESGFEPHPDCAETAKEAYGLDLCKWTTWAPEWFGTQCATGWAIVIGGILAIIILPNLLPKK